jgi:hypothetical protein
MTNTNPSGGIGCAVFVRLVDFAGNAIFPNFSETAAEKPYHMVENV